MRIGSIYDFYKNLFGIIYFLTKKFFYEKLNLRNSILIYINNSKN